MNRVLHLMIAVTMAPVARAAMVAAQGVRLGLGGGLISPLSDYKDVDKVGWHATVNATFAIPLSPVGIRVDGLYGQTSHKDIGTTPVDGKTKLIGGLEKVVEKNPEPETKEKQDLHGWGGVYYQKETQTSEAF